MRWRTRKLPSCHHPCVNPVSSRTLLGSLKKIWQETAKTPGSPKASSRGARKSGVTRISLFSKTTMPFRASRKPSLEPPPKPRFTGRANTRTDGWAVRRNSALPSVDPLSTIRISLSGLPARASITEGRYFSSSSLPFQLGITTETAPFGRGSNEGAVETGRGTRRRNRSVRARVSAAIATSTGESSSNGSERRNRLRNAMSTGGGQIRAQPDFPAQLHPAGSADQAHLPFQPAPFLFQAERPGGALLQFPFGPMQRLDRLGEL